MPTTFEEHTEELSTYGELSKVRDKLSSLAPVEPADKRPNDPIAGRNARAHFSAVIASLLAAIIVLNVCNSLNLSLLIHISWDIVNMSVIAFAVWNVNSVDGNPEHKIRGFFEKIFYSKKRQNELHQYHLSRVEYEEDLKSYEQAKEMHTLLVQQEIELLKQRGIFEKQSAERNVNFWHINEEGELKLIKSKEYSDLYLNGASVGDAPASNSHLHNKIVEAIIENHEKSEQNSMPH